MIVALSPQIFSHCGIVTYKCVRYKAYLMKFSIHQHLIGLVFVAVIPLMLFTSGLVIHLANQRSQILETNILTTTKALASAVDENIVSVATSLRILSQSEGFEADTVQFLHKRLRNFVKKEKDWDHISFVDTRGVQIFNTSQPFGKRLPRLNSDPNFMAMLKTKKMVISGYRPQERVITVSVPVERNGVLLYGLIGSLKLDTFTRHLKAQNLPDNWTAAILDSDMTYISHSRNPEFFTGRTAAKVFVDKSKAEGAYVFSYENDQGAETFGAIANSKITNWKIILRIPDDGHLFTSWKTIIWIVAGGTLILGLSIMCALWVARKIASSLRSLARSARALGQGTKVPDIRTSLSEVSLVNDALKAASIERSHNEKQIRDLYAKAQEAVKIRDTFMSVASHELKTPITTIKLQFQLLKRMVTRNASLTQEELDKPIGRVDNVVNRLNVLIDDLLDVSRISAGKLTYHPEPVQLGAFVNEIIQNLEEETVKNDCAIYFQENDQVTGEWDKHRLEQVIVNLITNAIKYGSAKPIFISVKSEGQKAVIEVKDQGMGISPENMEKIFDRFERVGNHNGISGLGLGLWIVKKVLEGFEGSITVESEVGKGSTFKVYLPQQQENLISFENINH